MQSLKNKKDEVISSSMKIRIRNQKDEKKDKVLNNISTNKHRTLRDKNDINKFDGSEKSMQVIGGYLCSISEEVYES